MMMHKKFDFVTKIYFKSSQFLLSGHFFLPINAYDTCGYQTKQNPSKCIRTHLHTHTYLHYLYIFFENNQRV